MWRELRKELGIEIVTVALDTDRAAAIPWIEKAAPDHPSLIDAAHAVDAWFGIVNVPSGVWIDERGTIVRPPETAYPRRPAFLDTSSVPEVRQLRIDADRYVGALREWAKNGRFALAPDEVVRRSRARSFDEASAALEHLREAVRLQPDNWTYKRQAWKLGMKGGDWLTDVRRIGPENYYPSLEL